MISDFMKPKVAGNSVIREMFEEGKRLADEYGAENVFDFSLGNPNVPAPNSVRQAIVEILASEDPLKVHGYMSNAGFPEVRAAIADSMNKAYGTAYSAENVIMTCGAASAMNVALKTILDPGDEVICIAPYFVEYNAYIENYGGKPVVAAADPENGFRPAPELLTDLITDRTKAIILNTPNNPTGAVYDEATIAGIAEVLRTKQEELGSIIYIVSDEPYRELVYTGEEPPHIPKIYDNTVICYSYSKSLSLPGERIGYLLVPPASHESAEFTEAATIANRIIGSVNAPSLIQLALARCLDEKADVDFYRENGRLLYDGLKDMGFNPCRPEGAFYLWVKSPLTDDRDFVQELKKENILVTPGSAFKGPGYVRISYCVSKGTIESSFSGFKKVAERLKLKG